MTSASTLIRRAKVAEKKGHKFAAKRLREQAATMRRKARKAKKAKKVVPAKMIARLAELLPSVEQPKSELDLAVERVLGPKATAARAIGMRRELVEARKTGENNAAAKHASTVNMMTESHRICMVSSLIAIVEHAEKLNGSLPPTMVVSGYLLAKVVDALRLAGYTSDGLNGSGTNRDAIAVRVSESRKGWQIVEAERPE